MRLMHPAMAHKQPGSNAAPLHGLRLVHAAPHGKRHQITNGKGHSLLAELAILGQQAAVLLAQVRALQRQRLCTCRPALCRQAATAAGLRLGAVLAHCWTVAV